MRKRFGELLLLAATVTALGCSEKDATKCQEALDGTRKSVAASDLVLTSQWRERSYKYCEDQASLATLDKEIAARQSAEAAAKAAEAQRLALNAGLLKTFVTWAGDNRSCPGSRIGVTQVRRRRPGPSRAEEAEHGSCRGRAVLYGDAHRGHQHAHCALLGRRQDDRLVFDQSSRTCLVRRPRPSQGAENLRRTGRERPEREAHAL